MPRRTPDVDIAIIGAGVVGLAIGRHLARRGREVLILDRADRPGTGISARNSGVIHAGIYYSQNTLKATLCVAGRQMLYDYCRTRHIEHKRCGKLIVAKSDAELPRLAELERAALRNGVEDIVSLNAADLACLEPALRARHALLSPSTGILDTAGFVQSLAGEAQAAGAMIALRTHVSAIMHHASGVRLEFGDPEQPLILARHVINAAGLSASAFAAMVGSAPQGLYAKGNYFALNRPAPFSHLVYPLPEQHGLGIHLTLDLAGQARFGPDVEWVEAEDYTVSPARADSFYAGIRSYWPDLPDGSLVPDYAGIRPKLAGGRSDFLICRDRSVVHLLGIESPGLTASLAIAEHVGQMFGHGTEVG